MNQELSKSAKIISWVCQIGAALVLLQTLRFKFTAHPESVYIFATLGMEPAGRWIIGVLELFTGIGLLIPSIAATAAFVGLGLMFGAIFAHLTKLGIVVQNDGGFLFMLALVVVVCCAIVVWIRRKELPLIGRTM